MYMHMMFTKRLGENQSYTFSLTCNAFFFKPILIVLV